MELSDKELQHIRFVFENRKAYGMKILIIMAGFFPGEKYGGPPVSVDNFCSLMSEHECFIITSNHDKDDNQPYDLKIKTWIDRTNCKVMYLPDCDYKQNAFDQIIQDLHPDIIYLQGLFQGCVLPCLRLARKYNIKVLLAPRGELCAGAFKKKYKKIPYIYFLKLAHLLNSVNYQSTSDEETEAIKKYLNASDNRIFSLTNIPSIPNKIYDRRIKEIDIGHFVFISRIHPKKNLIGTIRCFQNVHGKAKFDIYGPIEDKAYWEECQAEINKLPGNIEVNYCGLVSHSKVHSIFSKYDAFIFLTFSENYGHVIAESLIVGTPVIIGKGTTPWDDIDEVAGYVSKLEDEKEIIHKIERIIEMTTEEHMRLVEKTKKYTINRLRISDLTNEYLSSLEQIRKS